jgi:hypothetical protein
LAKPRFRNEVHFEVHQHEPGDLFDRIGNLLEERLAPNFSECRIRPRADVSHRVGVGEAHLDGVFDARERERFLYIV